MKIKRSRMMANLLLISIILFLICLLLKLKSKIKILDEQNKSDKIRIKNMQDILYAELDRKTKELEMQTEYEMDCV